VGGGTESASAKKIFVGPPKIEFLCQLAERTLDRPIVAQVAFFIKIKF